MHATISLRVSTFIWMDEKLCAELLSWMKDYRGTITEIAFFTGFTHPPLPLAEIQRRADLLSRVIPQFKALGLRTGINHLATIGHLDENLENSLSEPWQHLVDMSGKVSASCYCAAVLPVQDYIRESYRALAVAGPDFIWVDDDVRLESHPQAVTFACFCDQCLADFAKQSGTSWTREALVEAFRAAPLPERLDLRRAWLQHNRDYISRILALVRAATDSVNPSIELGFMSGEISYSGYGYIDWGTAMAGPRQVHVKWRPGGGFYTDERPTDMLGKVHSVGRQLSFLPGSETDIQWEHENFPYQVLKKSRTIFLAEIAGGIGAGCTGTALNLMGIAADPFDEYRPYLDAVAKAQPFFNELVRTFGRSPCDGVWPALGNNHIAALSADGNWPGAGAWGSDMGVFNELFELGVPPAYSRDGAHAFLLSGDSVLEWSDAELTDMLSAGVLLDAPAATRLEQRGLAELVGFTVAGTKVKDTTERFTVDPLNGKHAGWHRDCRPSFWSQTTYLLKPAPGARPLSEIIDFTPRVQGCGSGVFENRLGGRVAVFGYYPWGSLQCLGKSVQMKNVCRWLARDRLPACVSSFHRMTLWCRRDAAGHPAFLLLNASLDTATGVKLQMRTDTGPLAAFDMQGKTKLLKSGVARGAYRTVTLPPLPPWSALLLRAMAPAN
jgi:hypothetical protein